MYKYFPPESVDFILTKEGVSLRFSQPEILNDPFELKPSMNTIFGESQIYNEIKNQKGLHSKDDLELMRAYEEMRRGAESIDSLISEGLNKTIGILSLSKNKNSRSMWSYYAKDHSGFLISFHSRESKGKFKVGNYEFLNVNYTKIRPDKLDISAVSPTEDLLHKDDDWTHEQEVRAFEKLGNIIAVDVDPNGYPIHSITISDDHIDKIILGARSSATLERKVKFWMRKYDNGMILEKAEPCKREYKLIYNRIT